MGGRILQRKVKGCWQCAVAGGSPKALYFFHSTLTSTVFGNRWCDLSSMAPEDPPDQLHGLAYDKVVCCGELTYTGSWGVE